MIPTVRYARALSECPKKDRTGDADAPGVDDERASVRRRPDGLTPREQEVLELIWAGLTNRALSEYLHFSAKTGEAHRGNMMKKLGVSNMAQLLRQAIETGLLPHTTLDL